MSDKGLISFMIFTCIFTMECIFISLILASTVHSNFVYYEHFREWTGNGWWKQLPPTGKNRCITKNCVCSFSNLGNGMCLMHHFFRSEEVLLIWKVLNWTKIWCYKGCYSETDVKVLFKWYVFKCLFLDLNAWKC